MTEVIIDQAEFDQWLTSISGGESDTDKERERHIAELKKSETLLEIISSIRSGYMGEYRYNFHLSFDEAAELINKYVKRQK